MLLEKTKPKPKISLIVSDLSSSGSMRWGGAVRPFLLAKALQKLGYPVELLGVAFNLSYNTKAPTNTKAYDPEIPIVSIPCQYYSGFLSAAKELVRRIDGDIIYAVKLKPTSFGIAVIKKLLNRRPLILDIDDWELSWHGGDEWLYRPGVKQFLRDIIKSEGALRHPDHPLYLKWMENLVSYADQVTIHNNFLQQRFGGIYIPNGKDISLFNPDKYNPTETREKYGLSEHKILMFPGAPRPYKGVEDVLIALDKLNQPDLRLVIVGGSPYDDYDQQLTEKWGKWIIKLPKQSYDTMPQVVSAAHVIVVPQRDEPAAQAQFPLKLTDGMAMSKPVLATKVGDIPNILGDTGYLVEPNSPDQIAEQIQWIFAHLDEANSQGIKARQRCIEKYSLASMSAILEQIIAQI